MKRVLQINISNDVYGGVQSLIVNVYRRIDRSKIQFDFLSPDGGAGYESVKDEIEGLGGRFFDLGNPRRTVSQKLRYARDLKAFLRKNHYEIVHIHTGVLPFAAMNAFVAKRCGVKKIIVHSHNYDPNRNILKRLLDFFLKCNLEKNATVFLSCSDYASKALFTRRSIENGLVTIVKNGIEINKYQYTAKKRRDIRHRFGLGSEAVYGNIGRFEKQKNHDFLLDIFYHIRGKQEGAKLVLVGGGELEEKIKEKITVLGLNGSVIMTGFQDDVQEYYSAFDAMIMPSYYEGFPMVAIEAAASNLKIFCSDSITRTIDDIGDVTYLALEDSAEIWANKIIDTMKKDTNRAKGNRALVDNKYDIVDTVEVLEDIYLSEVKVEQ